VTGKRCGSDDLRKVRTQKWPLTPNFLQIESSKVYYPKVEYPGRVFSGYIRMPISIEKNLGLDLTIFKAIGKVPFKEQMNALESFYEGAPTKNVIWDFMEMDEPNISNDELHAIVEYTKAHSAQRKKGRTALVVNTTFKYGLSRMASIFAEIENTPWVVNVFEDMDAAMAWVSELD
jgi:hypothetical protein